MHQSALIMAMSRLIPQVTGCAFSRTCRVPKKCWVCVCVVAVAYAVLARSSDCPRRRRWSLCAILPGRRTAYVVTENYRHAWARSESVSGSRSSAELLGVKRLSSSDTGEIPAEDASAESDDTASGQWHAEMSREEEEQCDALYNEITSLRSSFPDASTASTSESEETDLCKDADIEGLEAVTHFFQFLPVREDDYPVQSALFPSHRPVLMTSALTGRQARYHCATNANVCTVEDDKGKSFSVRIRRHKYRITGSVVKKTISKLRGYLTMHELFEETSLHSVECNYRLLALRDIVMQHGDDHMPVCVSSEAGVALNYFLLFSPMKANLRTTAVTIEAQKNSSPETERLARIARLNLSLQVLDLVGKIWLKHVVLPPLFPHHFRLSPSGTVYFLPLRPPRKAADVNFQKPEDSLFASSAAESRQVESPMREKHTVLTLLYIWCPPEAAAYSVSTKADNRVKLLEAILYPRCSDMPETLRQVIVGMLLQRHGVPEDIYLRFSDLVRNLLEEIVKHG